MEVLIVLNNLHVEDVKQSQVNLIHIQSVVLVVLMLSSLEDVHIEAVCIIWTTGALLDGTVVIAVTTESETRQCRYNRMESVHCITMCA
jgi:hypothetical protein